MPADLSAADPFAVVIAHLRAHPAVTAAFGGPDHVSGLVEAPWPHVRVIPSGGGDLGELLWHTTWQVQVEVIDHPANPVGQAALWRLAMTAAQAARDLTERAVTSADPVVSRVRPSGVVAWSPLPSGQGRWVCGLLITIRPPS